VGTLGCTAATQNDNRNHNDNRSDKYRCTGDARYRRLRERGTVLGSRIRDSLGDRVHINITSFNRQVLITGEAPNAKDKALVAQIVRNVENVESTVDEVAIMGNSNFSERSSDLIITGRIKASLLDSKDIFGTAFKVTTERGVAFLMGRVTERESKRATEAASVIPGVKKVVRVLEIISEDELARSQNAPSKK
jgi:osmotically-inducible protein OsmY